MDKIKNLIASLPLNEADSQVVQDTIQGIKDAAHEVADNAKQQGHEEGLRAGRAQAQGGSNYSRDVMDMIKLQEGASKRVRPFHLGEKPFKVFWKAFKEDIKVYPLDSDFKKRLLYECLRGEASRLVGDRLSPWSEDVVNITLEDYAEKLHLLFEPPSESENAKIEFENRYQQPGESAIAYMVDKRTLFEVAHPKNKDLQMLFNETTKGLTNEIVQTEMFHYYATNTQEYETKLRQSISAVQRRRQAGKISEAEAMGTESQRISASYRYVPQREFKIEPGMLNATSQPETRACFFCKKVGHLISNCPRKSAGLSATTASISEEQEEIEEVNYVRGSGYSQNRGDSKRPYRPFRGRFDPRGRYQKQGERRNPRVHVIYEDEQGQTRIGEELVEENEEVYVEEEPQEAKGEEAEGVHSIGMEGMEDTYDGMYSETDYFLGL